MKRFLLALLTLVLWSGFAFGAGSSSTVGTPKYGKSKKGPDQARIAVVSVVSVGDDATGAIPDASIDESTFDILDGHLGGFLISVCLDWGATPPTSGGYDIYVKADDMADIDLLGGVGVNLDTTSDLCLTPLVGGVYVPAQFIGSLTVSQSNAVNDATPTAYLHIAPW